MGVVVVCVVWVCDGGDGVVVFLGIGVGVDGVGYIVDLCCVDFGDVVGGGDVEGVCWVVCGVGVGGGVWGCVDCDVGVGVCVV